MSLLLLLGAAVASIGASFLAKRSGMSAWTGIAVVNGVVFVAV